MATLKRIIQQRRQPTSQHDKERLTAQDARTAMRVYERLEKATKRPDRRSDR